MVRNINFILFGVYDFIQYEFHNYILYINPLFLVTYVHISVDRQGVIVYALTQQTSKLDECCH